MYVMPRSSARLTASSALSSSLYMRKRLPPPKARIDTRAPVLPSTRVGSLCVLSVLAALETPAAMPPSAVLSRNRRREMLINPPSVRYRNRAAAVQGARLIQFQLLIAGHLLEIELVFHFQRSD